MVHRVFAGMIAIVAIGLGSSCGNSASAPAPPANPPSAAQTSGTVSFASDVKPILETHCSTCHLGGGVKGGFNMDTREAALIEGRNGPRIAPGNSAGSALLRHVRGEQGVKRMPPKGERLSDAEIAMLTAWIDQGAPWE